MQERKASHNIWTLRTIHIEYGYRAISIKVLYFLDHWKEEISLHSKENKYIVSELCKFTILVLVMCGTESIKRTTGFRLLKNKYGSKAEVGIHFS